MGLGIHLFSRNRANRKVFKVRVIHCIRSFGGGLGGGLGGGHELRGYNEARTIGGVDGVAKVFDRLQARGYKAKGGVHNICAHDGHIDSPRAVYSTSAIIAGYRITPVLVFWT
jgi:hypothetical protein